MITVEDEFEAEKDIVSPSPRCTPHRGLSDEAHSPDRVYKAECDRMEGESV